MNYLKVASDIVMANPDEFCRNILNETKDKNVLLFMTTTSTERLNLTTWINALKTNCSLVWISEIPSNPSYIDVFNALTNINIQNYEPDLVVAIGGGSTIDIAKACVGLSYLTRSVNLKPSDVLNSIKQKEYLNHPVDIKIYAVPTTAGTGSEVTRWSTVWDFEGVAKYSVDAPYLLPSRAYIISDFTLSMSERLTLSTGLDALCQAVEAYWAKTTNSMVQDLSKIAIRLLVEYLPKVVKDTQNTHYREKVSLGSLYSGLAFSNTRTTACHSISYPLTMKFGIEHGLACVLSLPQVLKLNTRAINDINQLYKALSVNSAEELQNWIDKITSDFVIMRLSYFGIKEDDLEELANLSFTLGRMNNNPIEITHSDVKSILRNIL